MENRKTAWENIFKDKGKFFNTPHPDIDTFVNLLKDQKAKKILDFGSGSGRHVVHLAKNGFEVIGIDISKTGIEITKESLTSENLNAELLVRDMTQPIPYPDGFFDGVISTQVINHGEKQTIDKIIKEITRVTRLGGIIFITVSIYEENPSIGVSKNKKMIAERTFVPLDGLEKGMIHYFFTPEELQNSFPGFTLLKSYMDTTYHHAILAIKE